MFSCGKGQQIGKAFSRGVWHTTIKNLERIGFGMGRKKKSRIFAGLLILSLFLSGLQLQGMEALAAVEGKGYTVSKKAGTYTEQVAVKLQAKKGYRVYYSTNRKLNTKQVLKPGKSKKILIKNTTNLYVYAVKKNKTIKAAQLKTIVSKRKYTCYTYRIRKSSETDAENSSGTPETPGTSENPETSENMEVESAITAAKNKKPEEKFLPDDYSENTVQTVTIGPDGILKENTGSESAVKYDAGGNGLAVVTVSEPGTYRIKGGSKQEPLKGISIQVQKDTGEVNLVWDSLFIDNSSFGTADGQDSPVFAIEAGEELTNQVTVFLKGSSTLKGNGSVYAKTKDGKESISLPGAVVEAKGNDTILTFANFSSTDSGKLTVIDSMDEKNTNYGSEDPSDGISCKGSLVLQGASLDIAANGDCMKGTGSGGAGGVSIVSGNATLKSRLGNGIKSKDGSILIYGGTVKTSYTKEDGINAKNYGVTVLGGKIEIADCYGDGIQAEDVLIAGDATELDIAVKYENAGKNFYDNSLGAGNYNTLTETNSTKTEVVNIDTGSHKGIKAGTKASSYSYQTVSQGSKDAQGNALEAGKTYTDAASGSLVIAGGKITIDTTATGIKYNGAGIMGRFQGNSGAAANDGQYIIGAPEDAIHSNNSCMIYGGNLSIASSDDAIACANNLTVTGEGTIDITACYEGIEAGEITIGREGDSNGPDIRIYSNDDGINAASKESTTYVYKDDSEEQYTKTTVAASGNNLKIYSGYVNVMIADDEEHTATLPVEGAEDVSVAYSADGDGIDCNGSFYAYGGTIVVSGPTSNANSSIDTDNDYYVGKGVTLLAVGCNGMVQNPTQADQSFVCTAGSGVGNTGGRPGGMGQPDADGNIPDGMGRPNADGNIPGQTGETGANRNIPGQVAADGTFPGRPDGNENAPGNFHSNSYTAGTAFGILDDAGKVMLSICPNKAYGYVFYSSPELEDGTSYTMYSGGSVSGNKLKDAAYDCRYETYDSSGASEVSS